MSRCNALLFPKNIYILVMLSIKLRLLFCILYFYQESLKHALRDFTLNCAEIRVHEFDPYLIHTYNDSAVSKNKQYKLRSSFCLSSKQE